MAWLINTLFTLLLGAFAIPLFAFAAGPVIGYAMVLAIVIGYHVVKRSVPTAEWRQEYAWCFLAPMAGFFLSRRLRQRHDAEAARVSRRVMLTGGAFLYARATVAQIAVLRDGEAGIARGLANPARTEAMMRRFWQGKALESVQRSQPFKEQTPERRAAIDATWRTVQRDDYREEIRKRGPGKTPEETRRSLRYFRLRPSQQTALDATWKSLPDGPDRSP